MRRLTAEQINLVIQALEQADGSPNGAAVLLGLPIAKVRNWIRFNKKINAAHKAISKGVRPNLDPAPKPPTEEDVLHRELVPEVPREHLKAVAQIEKEDEFIKAERWREVGVKGEEAELMISIERMHKHHFRSVMDFMGGGLTKMAAGIILEIDRITEQLAQYAQMDPTLRLGLREQEEMLRKDRADLLRAYADFFDKNNQAIRTKAMVVKNSKEEKPKKPQGFLAIQAQPGSNVNVGIKNGSEGSEGH